MSNKEQYLPQLLLLHLLAACKYSKNTIFIKFSIRSQHFLYTESVNITPAASFRDSNPKHSNLTCGPALFVSTWYGSKY